MAAGAGYESNPKREEEKNIHDDVVDVGPSQKRILPRKLPKFLSWEWARLDEGRAVVVVPAAALLLQTILVGTAVRFSFADLVQCDTFMNCLTLLLEFTSFLILKHRDTSVRSWEAPGGRIGAWLITLPKVAIIGVTLCLADPLIIKTAALFNTGFVVLYVAQQAWRCSINSSS